MRGGNSALGFESIGLTAYRVTALLPDLFPHHPWLEMLSKGVFGIIASSRRTPWNKYANTEHCRTYCTSDVGKRVYSIKYGE